MKYFFYSLIVLGLIACKNEVEEQKVDIVDEIATPQLHLDQANNLAALPLHCIETEYPNKMGHVTAAPEDQKRPTDQHPVFYGCFDWHSAVHGYWSAVTLIKQFPKLEAREELLAKIKRNLTTENIAVEIAYLNTENNKTFERTYGWAWLLKLQQELDTWEDPQGQELAQILKPLSDVVIERYTDYLPKLNYAIRVGEHSNTAFGMVFAWDYATHAGEQDFKNVIESKAKEFYTGDTDCPLSWEPSGYDFLSPCLEEIDIMRRIIPAADFHQWVAAFIPNIQHGDLDIEIGRVSDRSDGKLVHIDGLNLSRAWVLYGLISQYPQQYAALQETADAHLTNTLPNLVADDYAGGHWLGSFAIYALQNASHVPEDL
ncbi:DUF2891 domain-containing protein [Nonlabens ulvanivorans]|uniref:DUF2891 domain-containing protein n=1 Tax=Nonlabens ulvanivorans TaxID=906888 RepID=A0A084JX95_NONUL|nr:DUF2891 domain-containing protein [Nonlabens ulvanivorans]KEZ93579.1 hypothetical protein IL45_05075 [Nonlabens ulvanivorans]PRX14163.1 Protein of unknown function (DUF2891) [Nonlabens ulvanivorans]